MSVLKWPLELCYLFVYENIIPAYSWILFTMGLCGCVFRSSSGLVMPLISVELMILAASLNFCSVLHINNMMGYIFSVTGIIISGLILSIVFAAHIHSRRDYEDCD